MNNNNQMDLEKPVLIIDDEADIRDLMELTLIKMGLSVKTAAGVAEAKRLYVRMLSPWC